MKNWVLPTNIWKCAINPRSDYSFFANSKTFNISEESVISIRKTLHRNPEISGEEIQTAKYIRAVLEEVDDIEIISGIAGHGVIAVKHYGPGPIIAFRSELDALPIKEKNKTNHSSKKEGKSHACGHDGHMAILLDLIRKTERSNSNSGQLMLIFQPAEETGLGAVEMIKHKIFEEKKVDFCYALHNIPGLEKGVVFSKEGSFACASVGLYVEFLGKTAHAAHPEDAVNPIYAGIELVKKLSDLPKAAAIKGFSLTTPVSMQSGEKNFGTSPERAIVMITLRAALTNDLNWMMKETENIVKRIEKFHRTKANISFREYFPAVENSKYVLRLDEACANAKAQHKPLDEPFRWSEDFSQFSNLFPTAMFGLGAGRDCPPLHASTYDFPDDLIDIGSSVFFELFKKHIH